MYRPIPPMWRLRQPDRRHALSSLVNVQRDDDRAPPPIVAQIRGMETRTSLRTYGGLRCYVEAPGRHGTAVFLHGHPAGQPGDTAQRWLTSEGRAAWWLEARRRGLACVAVQAPTRVDGEARKGWDDDMRPQLIEACVAASGQHGPIRVVVGFSDGASESAYVAGTLRLPGAVMIGAPGVQGLAAVTWEHAPHLVWISDGDDVAGDGAGGSYGMPEFLEVASRRSGIRRDHLHGEVNGDGHNVPPRLAAWALDCAMGAPRPVWPWETREGW